MSLLGIAKDKIKETDTAGIYQTNVNIIST